jgi:hypothetical protein
MSAMGSIILAIDIKVDWNIKLFDWPIEFALLCATKIIFIFHHA